MPNEDTKRDRRWGVGLGLYQSSLKMTKIKEDVKHDFLISNNLQQHFA